MRYTYFLRKKLKLAANLTKPDRLKKLLYLSCMFEKINSINLLLQDQSLDVLTAYNKIKAFKKKIQH